MQVVITEFAGEVADLAADAIEAVLRRRPDAVVGVATGSSPVGTYDELGRRVAARTISLARASAFMPDEYVGLPAGHRESYRSAIERIFAAKVDIDPDRIHGPEGTSADIPSACAAYEQAIVDAGGIDLQLHPDVTLIVDTAAGSRPQLADYYREVWHNKPAWQGW